MKTIFPLLILVCLLANACNSENEKATSSKDADFTTFETNFLDAYWKQHPAGAIMNGYGKYYEILVVPDSMSYVNTINFSKQWLDSLNKSDYEKLSENNKISFNIIKNQLESDVWYSSKLKPQEWDPSIFNISAECDYIINQPYAPLDERLKILSKHLEQVDAYYNAAFSNLKNPTREHLEMAISQNKGGLSVFGQALTDSITASHLSAEEKTTLQQHIATSVNAMKAYADSLEKMGARKDIAFRDFRIGKELFTEKFKYDLATDLTPEQVYETAMADKKMYHDKMVKIADSLWASYYPSVAKPEDNLQLVQKIFDKIQVQHAKPADFFDSLTNHVHRMKKFIIDKKLFDFDTVNPPVVVRIMPAYAGGFSVASAEFTPAYQKSGTTFYNIDDLTAYTPEKAESALREYNNYASQLLSIHEAVPGHCLQGIYNNKKSSDVVRSVFQNGAMIEGWAVYTETMMMENGWDSSPEMALVLYKLKLRELANVLIDYQIQVLSKPKEEIVHLLTVECFQTQAQAEEKYHRATLSQVQLCSYYTGATAILSLREEYKKKMGDQYSLKDFHEMFLSFGSSPVKYIRERMLVTD